MAGPRRLVGLIGACTLVAGGLLALTPTPSGALTQITVTSSFDIGGGTLRQAFVDASSGGAAAGDDVEIIIPASVGTITLTAGQLVYDGGNGGGHSLTLRGVGNTITQATIGNRVISITGGASFTLDGLTITGGDSPGGQAGGGILGGATTAIVITNSSITLNRASNSGGGINTNATLTITNSTLSGNEAGSGGGGAFASGNMVITGSTISGNLAAHGGGLYVNLNRSATITNSTISGNSAAEGGGVFAEGTVALTYTTVVDNTANPGANLRFISTALTSFGSVVALPQGGGASCAGQSSTTSQGYSWDAEGTCGFGSGPGDHSNAGNPLLGALADNGGPTPTHLPQTGSGLLDKIPASSPCAGVNITVDQRGLPRPVTAGQFCDIGAVELTNAAVTAISLAPDFAG